MDELIINFIESIGVQNHIYRICGIFEHLKPQGFFQKQHLPGFVIS